MLALVCVVYRRLKLMKGIYCGSILFAQKKVIDQIRKKWWAKANQLLRLEEGVLLE